MTKIKPELMSRLHEALCFTEGTRFAEIFGILGDGIAINTGMTWICHQADYFFFFALFS